MRRLIPVLAMLAAGQALADCPPLSRYQVSGLTLRGGSLDAAIRQIIDGTAWRAEFSGPVQSVRMRMSGVSGDMDTVIRTVVETAAKDPAVAGVSSTIDSAECVIRVAAKAPAPRVDPAVASPAVAASAAEAPSAVPVATPAAETRALPAAPVVRPVWTARRGSTLRQSLESWAGKASCASADARAAGQATWTVAWAAADTDYRIVAPLTFEGSISEAAQAAVRLYENADVKLGLNVHPNQCVLHVFAAGKTP